MASGANLPRFQAVQLDVAAYIRNPGAQDVPAGIEKRRMDVYADLFYRNIEGFLSSTFRVFRSLLTDDAWHGLVRDFVHRHRSESPYFIQIPEEFLEFLADEAPDDPARLFRLELCHYEWVELALDFREDEPIDYIDDVVDAETLAQTRWRVSPLAWPLQYRYAVHEIGPANQPTVAPDAPTYLIVYRNRRDRVRFLVSNAATFRLLELLAASDGDVGLTIDAIAAELKRQASTLLPNVVQTFERLRKLDILVQAEGTTDR